MPEKPNPAAPNAAEAATYPAGLMARINDAAARGLAQLKANRPDQALAAFDEILALAPRQPDALLNRGIALRRLGRRDEAAASYLRAIAEVPDRHGVWVNAANALADLNRTAEARAALDAALVRQPMAAEAWLALAGLLQRKNLDLAAETCLRRAERLAPNDPSIKIRLAGILSARGMLDEALVLFDRARALGPVSPQAHSGYGQTLISQGKLDEAERHLRRALALDADALDAHLGLARLLLLKGELGIGWVEYEWRRRKPESKLPKLPGKEWDGSPIAGKTLLVYSEQGFGDVLQFCRYIPILTKLGARIIFAIPPQLKRLLQGLDGVATLITAFRPMPQCDFHIPLLSVPRVLGISIDRVPNQVPYLRVPPSTTPLPAPLGTRLKIGIVWAGSSQHSNDRNRSMTLEEMLPLAAIPGVTLYSLQAGSRVGDLAKLAHPALVRDLSRYLRDFADTAGVIANLDLVICADTAVAHLAAALGKPVWVLTPFSPDWRWLIGREDTPWYPTMRLLRQSEPGRWDDVMARIYSDLVKIVATRPELGGQGAVPLHSVFPAADGRSRFKMGLPHVYMADPGVRFLLGRERSGVGYEYATRCFIDAHLESGDLFLDIGAHWGVMALHAATRWPGVVKVIAFEAAPRNQTPLRQWIDMNGLGDAIEMIGAAVADKPGRGEMRPESTMGHSLVRAENGRIPVVTVDDILAARPHLANRRVMVKIDVEGGEPDVIAGMERLLASGRVTAIIWEYGPSYGEPDQAARAKALRERLAGLGFTAWRFASEDNGGALEPFVQDGRTGNVFELAPGLAPEETYAAERLPASTQPGDAMLDVIVQAAQRTAAGNKLQGEGKTVQALAIYAEAAALDQRQAELYNNLGVALRSVDRMAAAEAAYRRALLLLPGHPGNLSNLANLLRERGKLAEADALHRQALAIKPSDPRLIYNAGLVPRDDHRAADAQTMFERTLAIEPNNIECQWDRALILLQQGDYARGFREYESRWGLQRSRPLKTTLPWWQGEALNGRGIFLRDEQGFGDVLMFARFIPALKRLGAGRVVAECQPELMRLMAMAPGVDAVLRRGTEPAGCDLEVPLLSLPGLVGVTFDTVPKQVPYLNAPKPELPVPQDSRLKLGIVWAGKTAPRDRSIPLDDLLPILGDPRWAAWSFQMGPRAADMKQLGADAMIADLGPRLVDFAETAAVLKQVDALVTIDTATAHLAGALGVPTFLLLLYTSDWRWLDTGDTSIWYPSMKLFRQPAPHQWDKPLTDLATALDAFATERWAQRSAKASKV
ncbi:MAG TPA: FkbM family methyltransferase [Magnetospirillaceae bacterium]|jgi:FkbM family methyltransferase